MQYTLFFSKISYNCCQIIIRDSFTSGLSLIKGMPNEWSWFFFFPLIIIKKIHSYVIFESDAVK